MIHSISGKLINKTPDYAVVETSGVGYKIFISQRTYNELPENSSRVSFFCYHRIKQEEIPELYGFLSEKELNIFELLLSISGVGPKSAMNILDAVKIDNFLAAIKQGRVDLLSKSWGIGKKKGERIILELKDKIKKAKISGNFTILEADNDLKLALKNLGYKQKEIDVALEQISEKIKKTEDRLKEALKILNQR